MSKQIDFLKRCIALNLQSGGLLDLLDRIEELERERDAAFSMSKCECASDEACQNLVKLHNERDQLREQISSLKDELRQISTAVDDIRLDLTNTAAELIMEMKEQLAERDAEVTDLLKQNVMLCMYLSQIAWGNTAKQQSAWAEEALNKTKELSKLILCSKDHVAITKNDSEVEFFHIVPQKTLLYRAITDIRKVL